MSDILDISGSIKAVFCDLDGTLLDGRHLMPGIAFEAVERLQESGVAFVPTTGRTVHAMQGLFGSHFEELGLDYVACNGMDVRCDGMPLVHATCPREACAELVMWAERSPEPLGVVVYGSDEPYVFDIEADYVRTVIESLHDARVVAVDAGLEGGEVSKLGVVCHAGAAHLAQELTTLFGNVFEFSACGQEWVDVALGGHTKLGGARLLLRAHGMAPEEALAIGDSMNDAALLAALPRSVCVENAMDQVKALCAYEIGPNTSYSVARLLLALAERRRTLL